MNCPFEGCSFKSSVFSTFTTHKSRYHHDAKLVDLKPGLVVKCHSQAFVSDEEKDLNNSVSSDLLSESEFQPVQNSIQQADCIPFTSPASSPSCVTDSNSRNC